MRKLLLRLLRPLLPLVEQTFDIRIRTTEEFLKEKDLYLRASNNMQEPLRLNDALFADIRTIPPETLSAFDEEIRARCKTLQFSQDSTENWLQHRYRIYMTIQWLDQVLEKAGRDDLVLLEMGGQSIVTDILQNRYPRLQWINTEGDLRSPWSQASESVDVILSTEVLEHLAEVEVPGEINHGFFQTGITWVLQESWRVLRPGGRMLVTTPNGGSIIHLKAVLFGSPPWFYKPHHREYTFDELLTLFGNVGFDVEVWKDVHCLTLDLKEDYTLLFKMLVENSFQTAHRGDDLFFILRRPVTG